MKNETPRPDQVQKDREDKTAEAVARISTRAARRCWTPQEARAFEAWDR